MWEGRGSLIAFLATFGTHFSNVGAFVLPNGMGVVSKMNRNALGGVQMVTADLPGSTPEKKSSSDVRWRIRDAIWKASDMLSSAVEDRPSVPAKSYEGLERLGEVLLDLDDKLFDKRSSSGPTGQYLDSLSSTSPPSPLPPSNDTKSGSSMTIEQTTEVVESVEEPAADPVPQKTAVKSPTVAAASAAAKAKEAIVNAQAVEAKTKTNARPIGRKDAGGATALNRPKQIQGVFEELQKKAVANYKSTPTVAAPVVNTEELEAKLETLLGESNYCPAKLPSEQKATLKEILDDLMESYPQSATPLDDNALEGQWSLVYSSKKNLFSGVMGKKRSLLFKVSQPLQDINAAKMLIVNSFRLRLRLTPLGSRVTQLGSYKEAPRSSTTEGKRAFQAEFNRGRWMGLLPVFRKDKIEGEVTYLSKAWRICKSGDHVVAFRKVEE